MYRPKTALKTRKPVPLTKPILSENKATPLSISDFDKNLLKSMSPQDLRVLAAQLSKMINTKKK